MIRIESWLFFLSHNNRIHPCIDIMHAHTHTTYVSMCVTNNNKKSYATTYHREISTMSAGERWGSVCKIYRGRSYRYGELSRGSAARPEARRGRKFTFVLWNCRSGRTRRTTGRARVSGCRCRYIGPYIMHNIKTSPVVSRRAFNRVLSAHHPQTARVATLVPLVPHILCGR